MEAQPASSGAADAQHALSNAGARAANALDADIELALERHPELTKLTVRGTICWDVFGIDILGATAPVPANQPPMPALLGIAWQLKGPPGTAAAYVDEFAGALCRA